MRNGDLVMSSLSFVVVFDIDGVIRDVSGSYRRAIADTVEQFTEGAFRPTPLEIDRLKAEGCWNNDWEASQELIFRHFEAQGHGRSPNLLNYETLVTFFQSRYRGPEPDPEHWTGYICQEPLLLQPAYLESLTQAGVAWGFFSGATRGSARYVLERRLGLRSPVLVAMEDAPGKPDPTGLFQAVEFLMATHSLSPNTPVFYAGDTVADLYTVQQARIQRPERSWIGIGIIPSHAQRDLQQREEYCKTLKEAGAEMVLDNVEQLTPDQLIRCLNQTQ